MGFDLLLAGTTSLRQQCSGIDTRDQSELDRTGLPCSCARARDGAFAREGRTAGGRRRHSSSGGGTFGARGLLSRGHRQRQRHFPRGRHGLFKRDGGGKEVDDCGLGSWDSNARLLEARQPSPNRCTLTPNGHKGHREREAEYIHARGVSVGTLGCRGGRADTGTLVVAQCAGRAGTVGPGEETARGTCSAPSTDLRVLRVVLALCTLCFPLRARLKRSTRFARPNGRVEQSRAEAQRHSNGESESAVPEPQRGLAKHTNGRTDAGNRSRIRVYS
jgi:hypothetical protein